eukprot:TRINITY_DN797_c0_g1_i2.p1 TRINITY_DN797_c0_g1~~TRINITY_DN797_c0_g1_i2.p1  ORF type:complete len:365 (-),score=79.23 TRINITY_DN797_c0_g1_i2:3-1097(-)
MGFILQPSVIPSSDLQAVTPIDSHSLGFIDNMEAGVVGQDSLAKMKHYWETHPIWGALNSKRQKFSLEPLTKDNGTWKRFQALNVPLLVPMHAHAFGKRPVDWQSNTRFTDFIFLRCPFDKAQSLNDELAMFLEAQKKSGDPVVLIAFSSMPVSRRDIYNICIKMCDETEKKPRVIAVEGPRPAESVPAHIEKRKNELVAEQRLFVCGRAPFGILFDMMDAVVIHGGLGTTAEALRAKLPTIVTGVLLMDQRFWGQRCHDLGVGPKPEHVSTFHEQCVGFINSALNPDGKWKRAAIDCAEKIAAKGEGDGVQENIDEIQAMLQDAPIFTATGPAKYGMVTIEEEKRKKYRLRGRSSETAKAHRG